MRLCESTPVPQVFESQVSDQARMPGSGAVSESNEKSPEEFSIYDMPKILREEKWPKDLPTEIKKFVERLPGNSVCDRQAVKSQLLDQHMHRVGLAACFLGCFNETDLESRCVWTLSAFLDSLDALVVICVGYRLQVCFFTYFMPCSCVMISSLTSSSLCPYLDLALCREDRALTIANRCT